MATNPFPSVFFLPNDVQRKRGMYAYRRVVRFRRTISNIFKYRYASDGSGDDEMSDNTNMVEAEDVRLTYADGTEAVRGVNLTVQRGEFFGFLGPNGAGKTTTIKTLTTLLRPTSGTVRIDGFDVVEDQRSVRQSIGYMAQQTSVDPHLTARENVRFACEAYGVPRDERAERTDELLELVDLVDVANKRSERFSGGMKKRLDVATALVHRPKLVFLDEPTTGLDPKARINLWEYFRKINRQGTTVFLTTQYLEEADELCDRLSVIQDGKIVATDSPQALKSRVGGDVLDIAIEESSEEARERARRVASRLRFARRRNYRNDH